jgi:glycosyltransferase involved in cell wall biosynthesis
MRPVRRVTVVSENMGGVLDEGIRKFATGLLDGFRFHAEASGVATSGGESSHPLVRRVSGNKLYTGRPLRNEIESLRPELVVYVPSASATAFAFWRARMLKRYAPGGQVALVATQPRYHTALGRLAASEMAPDKVFAQSRETIRYLEWLGMAAQFLPGGVDLGRFCPVTAERKAALREELGLPQDAYLVLHVGHLRPGRNVELLTRLGGLGTPVVVAGKSMGQDEALRQRLSESGVVLIDRYLRDVEIAYQACDAYLFPVREEDSAMDFPLSVLEAMACNLPVVAHPYGGLPLALEPGEGLVFVESDEAMLSALEAVKRIPVATRKKAEPYAWEHVAGCLLETMQGAGDAGAYVGAV